MTDKKTAEAELKAAERAWNTKAAKAAKTREVYLEAQADANAAARELDFARANPALFDDDPLQVVTPGGSGSVSYDFKMPAPAPSAAIVMYPPQPPVVATPAQNTNLPVQDNDGGEPYREGDVVEQQEIAAAPWLQEPVAASPAPTAEAPKRKRRTKKQIEDDNAAAAAAAAPPQQVEQAAAPAPWEEPQFQTAVQNPAPYGYDPQTGAPNPAPQQQQAVAPAPAPWESGAAPLY